MSKTEGWQPGAAPAATPSDATDPHGPRTEPSAPRTVSFEAEASPVLAPSMTGAPRPELQVRVPAGAQGVREVKSEMLRHFRIDRKLAAGGMGEVFLGYDTSLSRPVALKTIRPELAQDKSFLARFVREATAQANVVHPHVVQVYFVGEEQGQWFLAMQIVDGGSLHDGLGEGKKMRWQDAARHMRAVADGLVVAERLGIVHRDIKPSNILVDRDGRALLSDFGLAASSGATDPGMDAAAVPQPSGSQLQLQAVTQVGVIMGTPEYVAPEQLKVGPLDPRADMYALAATFFHLVSGAPVMPVKTLADAIAKYAAGHRAALLRTVAPGVPRAFADVIDRCLEVDPAKRYATMQELARALERAMPQPEVPASPSLRALVWLLDIAPFLAITWATYTRVPFLGPLLFFLFGAVGIAALGATPGIWLMRLRLRTQGDGDVSFSRAFARFLVQHGWYVPLSVGFSAVYGSSNLDVLFLLGAAWLALSIVGALGSFTRSGRALHDIISGTRVLVDVRYR